MPIYEYACACGKRFEELLIRRSDEDDVRCPACHGKDVARAVSRPAAHGSTATAGASPRARACGPVG
jgi:putative FmdB family regulatory protein